MAVQTFEYLLTEYPSESKDTFIQSNTMRLSPVGAILEIVLGANPNVDTDPTHPYAYLISYDDALTDEAGLIAVLSTIETALSTFGYVAIYISKVDETAGSFINTSTGNDTGTNVAVLVNVPAGLVRDVVLSIDGTPYAVDYTTPGEASILLSSDDTSNISVFITDFGSDTIPIWSAPVRIFWERPYVLTVG